MRAIAFRLMTAARRVAHAAGRSAGRITRSELGLVAASVLVTATLLSSTPLGAYLDEAAFLKPLHVTRARFGFGPRLVEEIRLVLLDDRSLQKIGHQPSFSEWLGVARMLRSIGFERVLVNGFPVEDAEMGAMPPQPPGLKVYLGSVATQNAGNPYAIPYGALPYELTLGRPAGDAATAESARFKIIGPRGDILNEIAGVGDLSIEDGNTMRPIVGDDQRAVPNLALWASGSVALEADAVIVGGESLPRSADARLHVDFVTFADSAAKSVPASAFFAEGGTLALALSEKTALKLRGGKVAIIVPEAKTGQRFLDTALGKLPSYLAVTSLANAVLSKRPMFVPLRTEWLEAMLVLALIAMVRFRKISQAMIAHGVLAIVILATGIVGLQTQGWLLPAASLIGLISAATIVRLGRHYAVAAMDRIRLSKDLELGSIVQSFCLPQTLCGEIGHWRYHVEFRPYAWMSGDWVQVFAASESKQPFAVLAIGDVVGKGPSAALATAVMTHVWRSFEVTWREGGRVDLEELCLALDRALYRTFVGKLNSTLQLALLTESGFTCTRYAAAKWIKIGLDSGFTQIRTRPSGPLGGSPEPVALILREEIAAPGDIFMAFTDGVMEGGIAIAKFRNLVAGKPLHADPDAFAKLVVSAREAGEESVLPDDFTMVLIQRLPDPSDVSLSA